MLRNNLQGIYKLLELYASDHTSKDNLILQQIQRNVHLHTLKPQMISGEYQGALLSFFSRMIRPNRILEIGTFAGYSAVCLASGLADKGLIDTIELNEELESLIRNNLALANLTDKVNLHLGDASEIIQSFPNESFDIIFIDADKNQYPYYYEHCLPLLSSRGVMIIDNVLWDGKVIQETKDKKTQVIHDLNQKITEDPRVDNILLNIRDGMQIIMKKIN